MYNWSYLRIFRDTHVCVHGRNFLPGTPRRWQTLLLWPSEGSVPVRMKTCWLPRVSVRCCSENPATGSYRTILPATTTWPRFWVTGSEFKEWSFVSLACRKISTLVYASCFYDIVAWCETISWCYHKSQRVTATQKKRVTSATKTMPASDNREDSCMTPHTFSGCKQYISGVVATPSRAVAEWQLSRAAVNHLLPVISIINFMFQSFSAPFGQKWDTRHEIGNTGRLVYSVIYRVTRVTVNAVMTSRTAILFTSNVKVLSFC